MNAAGARAVDTSVVVPAASPWHQNHRLACSAWSSDMPVRLPAHVAVETYAVLTRLPPPHRVALTVARERLAQRFGDAPVLTLSADQYGRLLDDVAAAGISGGAVYDALVAATSREAGSMLLTLDRRAKGTYEALGIAHRLLG